LLNQLADWLEDRTGYRAIVHEALEEPIPGGARWRYVFGSALSTTFVIQLATGLLLMCSYSPSSSTAWGSVFYINHDMTFGWFLRGIHHFGSQAMIVLLAMHLLQVLVAGAYRAPREVNWWFGMALMFLTLGFSLTGYLLPWDEKGYWATKVATNIMGGAPVLGPYLQKVVVGGSDYGNQTLTRFYGLHVGVLPTLFVCCLAAHVALFRRHGLTPPRDSHKRTAGKFWPEQLFMDSVASVAVFGVILYLVLSEGGANLDAPADPSSSDYPARPEWYFLSLFQLLKLFPGKREVIGTIIIPTAIMVVLFLIPLFDRVLPSKFAHFLACCLVFALVGGAGYLTNEAWNADAHDAHFQSARARADEARKRALALASNPEVRIPPDGSAYILLRDPLYHGKDVLERKCLGCHVHEGKGMGQQSASDLKDFGSRTWVRGLLENPRSNIYFGKVPQCDGMVEWKKSSKLSPKQLDDVADFVASFATIPADMTPDEWLEDPRYNVANHPGQEPFVKECGECHVVEGLSEGGTRDAPRLFAWGSPRWIERMIHKPGAPDLYGYLEKKDQMPPFAEQLTGNDVTTVVRFLKGLYPGVTDSSAPRAQVARGK
jgi:quinol-cytochrome oxidoreductase complex cytochrome b subunit/mono/diheme cytochrome c family protein